MSTGFRAFRVSFFASFDFKSRVAVPTGGWERDRRGGSFARRKTEVCLRTQAPPTLQSGWFYRHPEEHLRGAQNRSPKQGVLVCAKLSCWACDGLWVYNPVVKRSIEHSHVLMCVRVIVRDLPIHQVVELVDAGGMCY